MPGFSRNGPNGYKFYDRCPEADEWRNVDGRFFRADDAKTVEDVALAGAPMATAAKRHSPAETNTLVAVMAAVFVLASNTLLRPVVNSLNRQPISEKGREVTYQFCLIVDGEHQKGALATLEALLEGADYPLEDLDVKPFGEDDVGVTATLLSMSVKSEELDRIAEKLGEADYVKQAFWNPSTTE